jgi:hypothetical protein
MLEMQKNLSPAVRYPNACGSGEQAMKESLSLSIRAAMHRMFFTKLPSAGLFPSFRMQVREF